MCIPNKNLSSTLIFLMIKKSMLHYFCSSFSDKEIWQSFFLPAGQSLPLFISPYIYIYI